MTRNREGLKGLTKKDVYPIELFFPRTRLENTSMTTPEVDGAGIPLPRILQRGLSTRTKKKNTGEMTFVIR
jgi:hypothetical protein